MSVYVDDMKAPYRGMLMCHMAADSTEELLAMVDRIGVQRKWIQYPGTAKEHFDICVSKREQAVRYGAREVTQREFALRYMKLAGHRVTVGEQALADEPQGNLFGGGR